MTAVDIKYDKTRLMVEAPLGVEDITALIRRLGWKKNSHPNPNLLVYENGVDDLGRPIKLVLPNGNGFADAPRMLSDAIGIISWVNGYTPQEVRQLAMDRGIDIFRQRIVGDTRITGLPLGLAARVLHGLRELVYYAACMEEDPQPFFQTGRKIGREYAETCLFGHTFPGSFGLSIEMPIPPNPVDALLPANSAAPLERRIMNRIMRGLVFSAQAVREGDVTILTNNVSAGFNANLCETMTGLAAELSGFRCEYSMLWSPEFSVAADLQDAPPVTIDPGVFRPYFESAARSLRTTPESQESTIVGKVTQLQADMNAGQDTAGGKRRITIQWEMADGRSVSIRASLGESDYKAACDAHRDGRLIEITGIPERVGKSWRLTSPRDFRAPSSAM